MPSVWDGKAHTGGPWPPALSPAATTWAKGPARYGGARVVLLKPGGARGVPTRGIRWGVREISKKKMTMMKIVLI